MINEPDLLQNEMSAVKNLVFMCAARELVQLCTFGHPIGIMFLVMLTLEKD